MAVRFVPGGAQSYNPVEAFKAEPAKARASARVYGGSGGGSSQQSGFDYQAELRKQQERERIAAEQKKKEQEAQRIRDQFERNKRIARIRLEASQEREQYRSTLTPVQYSKFQQEGKKRYKQQVQEFEKEYPEEKLVYGKEGEVVGIESKAYGKTLSLTEYNKQLDKTLNQVRSQPLKKIEQPKTPATQDRYIKIAPVKIVGIPKEIVAGKLGREFVGVSVPGYRGGILPTYKIKEAGQKAFSKYPGGYVGEAALEFIPETPLDIGVYYVGGKAFQIAPKAATIAFSGLGTYQTVTAQTPKERAVGIITAGLPLAAKGGEYIYYKKIQPKVELRFFERALKREEPVKYKEYLELKISSKKLLGVSPEVQEISLARLGQLEKYPSAQRELIKYFSSEKRVIVGGSISQQAQLQKGIGGTRRPGDIDVYVKKLTLAAEERGASDVAANVASRLRRSGVPGVMRKGSKVSVAGEKLFEAHPYKSYLEPNIEAVIPFYKSAYRSGVAITPSGAKVLRLDIQLQRKLIGGYLEPYISGKTRIKDIPAFYSIRKSLVMTSENVGGRVRFDVFENIDIAVPKGLKMASPRLSKGGKPRGDVFSEIGDYYTPGRTRFNIPYPTQTKRTPGIPYTKTPRIRFPEGPQFPSLPPKPRSPNLPYLPKRRPSAPSRPLFPKIDEPITLLSPIRRGKKSREYPKLPFLKNLFKTKSSGKRKKQEVITVTEGFISNVLGRKAVKIKESDIPSVAEEYRMPLSFRRGVRL